jgi:hypothetical protein
MDKNNLIVLGVFVVGVAAIVFLQNPPNACNKQLEIFSKTQAGFLYSKSVNKKQVSASFFNDINKCREGNSVGSCYSLVNGMRNQLEQLDLFPDKCSSQLLEVNEIKGSITRTVDLFVQIAWGEAMTDSYRPATAWLEPLHLDLFCDLNQWLKKNLEPDDYQNFKNNVLAELPGEPRKFIDGSCVNCDTRKKSIAINGLQKTEEKSLFKWPCR